MTKRIKPKTNEDGSVSIPLRYPVEWGEDGLVTEITLKRLKGKQLKGINREGLSMQTVFNIASKVSDYTPAFFDELDGTDCMVVSEVIGDFLDDGQAIGKTA